MKAKLKHVLPLETWFAANVWVMVEILQDYTTRVLAVAYTPGHAEFIPSTTPEGSKYPNTRHLPKPK